MKDLKEKTCCFTGHRQISSYKKFLIKYKLKKEVEKLIIKGIKYFGTGGALGFDTIAAQVILKLKKKYKNIYLILILPCENQTIKWNKDDIEIYNKIKSKADKIVYVSKKYTSDCMMRRNRHMVDNSKHCICYFDGTSGGTKYTVDYAISKGLSIINIYK